MMKKYYKILILFIFLISALLSCTSAEYIRTGEEYSPTGWNAEVAVLSESESGQNYEKIGIVRIRGGDLEDRIDKAKLYARKKGGNALIAREIGVITDPATDTVVEEIGTSTYETQEFVVVKLSVDKAASVVAAAPAEPAEQVVEDYPDIEEDMPASPSIDYDSLPRATYRQLVKDYQSLGDSLFKGSLFPKKIYKIPSSLKEGTESGDRLIMLTTSSGKSKLFLIADKESLGYLKSKIQAGEKLDFVYSSAGVYRSSRRDYPVLKYIEEIK